MDNSEYRRLFECEDQLRWYVGMRRITLTLLRHHVDTSTPVEVLDAGCGTGGMLTYLGQLGCVTGFDYSSEALAEMARVLRSTGSLLIRVPAYNWIRSSHDEAVHAIRRYNRRELEAKLVRAGFGSVHATYANTLLFPIAAVYRFFGSRGRRRSRGSDVVPVPRPLNGLFLRALRIEETILRFGRLPFGLSLIAVARPGPRSSM